MREDGKVDYVELPGGDLPAVKTFYAVLSAEQRKAFDELPLIGIGGRHAVHGGGRFRGRPSIG